MDDGQCPVFTANPGQTVIKKMVIEYPVTTIPPHKRLMNIWFWSNNS